MKKDAFTDMVWSWPDLCASTKQVHESEPMVDEVWHWWEMYVTDPNDEMIDRDGVAQEYGKDEAPCQTQPEAKEMDAKILDVTETPLDPFARCR